MAKDKYTAVWVSHSSISDFLKCPRLYYLRNVYKNPKNGHKMTIMSPPLALGQAVHDVIEEISGLPIKDRLGVTLGKRLDNYWKKVEGELGGFSDTVEEKRYKKRGYEMLKNIEENPGPLINKAVKIKAESGLPYYWLSEKDNIILCGKIDWIEYLPDDSVHIIDFKTGKNEEKEDSLQLPIYHLIAANTQKRKVKKISYWYIDLNKKPVEVVLPDLMESESKILDIARRIKLGRQINHLKCPQNGCFACRPFEDVLLGKAKFVGLSTYKQDIYIFE